MNNIGEWGRPGGTRCNRSTPLKYDMSEEQKKAPEVRAPKDWDTDTFPTSAKKIFVSWGLMILGIIVLCVVVYSRSEHPDTARSDSKAEARARLSEFSETGAEDEE